MQTTTLPALIEELEKQYPNRADVLKDKSHEEVVAYIAQLEVIEFIKTLHKKG